MIHVCYGGVTFTQLKINVAATVWSVSSDKRKTFWFVTACSGKKSVILWEHQALQPSHYKILEISCELRDGADLQGPALSCCASTCLRSTCSSLGGIFSSHCNWLVSCTRVRFPAVLSVSPPRRLRVKEQSGSVEHVSSSGMIKEVGSS